MVDLSKVIKQASELNEKSIDGYPPVEKWNPEHCGDIGLEIKSDGTWFYMGTPIGRKRIVKLFSRILRKEEDGSYVLVTPVEKISIEVEDAPFIANSLEISGKNKECNLKFFTNVDDSIIASKSFPIRVEINPDPRSAVITSQSSDSSFALPTSSSGAIMVVFPFFSNNPIASPQKPVI